MRAALTFLTIGWLVVQAADQPAATPAPGASPVPQPTADPTVAALEREKLEEEVKRLRWDNDRDLWHWLWDNSVVLGAVVAGVFGVYRWSVDRRDARMRQAEERFQALAADLDSDRMPTQTNAAVTLRTFLRPGYEDYYAQVFNLAVAHIRIQPLPEPLNWGPGPFMQALTAAYLEAFHLARDWVKYGVPHPAGPRWRCWQGRLRKRRRAAHQLSQYAILDSSRVGFVYGNFVGADLREAWLPFAEFIRSSLTDADLSGANLQNATIGNSTAAGVRFVGADLRAAGIGSIEGADLTGADFTNADLAYARLTGDKLQGARFAGADLTGTDLTGADLTGANPEAAKTLAGTKMLGIVGLTAKQHAACKAKGAILDDEVHDEVATSEHVEEPG